MAERKYIDKSKRTKLDETESPLIAAAETIDFSTSIAFGQKIFKRMIGMKISYGWDDALICWHCGVKHCTWKKFLTTSPEAKEIWDSAREEHRARLNDLAKGTLIDVMQNSDDDNARIKAAQTVVKKLDFDLKDTGDDDAGAGRMSGPLLAQQIVVRIVHQGSNVTPVTGEITATTVDALAQFEPVLEIDQANGAAPPNGD